MGGGGGEVGVAGRGLGRQGFQETRLWGGPKEGKLRARWWTIAAGAALAVLLASAVQAATPVYVNGGTGSDTYDGTSATWVSGTIGPKKTVQAGIGVVDSGGTVHVAAGTYNEQVNVPKSLTLLGPNANSNPGLSGTRPNGEAIIAYGGALTNLGTGSTLVVSANNVVVNGFTITNGSTAENQVGVLIGGNYVGDTTHPADAATIEYNIVSGGYNSIYIWESKDNRIEGNRLVNAYATLLFVGDWEGTGKPIGHPTGNAIVGNYLDKGGVGVSGHGIWLGHWGTPDTGPGFSGTTITGNTITDTSSGVNKLNPVVVLENANAAAGSPIVIGGAGPLANTISKAPSAAWDDWEAVIKLQDSSNIELRRNVVDAGSTYAVVAERIAGLTVSGLEVTSTGAVHGGANLVHLKGSSAVTVAGNVINVIDPAASGNAIHIEDATGTTSVSGNQVSVTGSLPVGGYFHGIRLDGASSTGTFSVTGNTFLGTAGDTDPTRLSAALRVALPAGITSLTATGNLITGFRYYVLNTSVHSLDLTANTLDGTVASAGTLAQQFGFADKIVDAVDVGTYGLVRTKATNVYVTPLSFYASGTTTPSIQRGINAATAGDTVNVADGTYSEHITIDKSLTLQGGSNPVIDGAGTGTAVTISASSVTATGFTIQNALTGIAGTSGTGNAVHFCNIVNNTTWGVNNTSGNVLSATHNYWGSDSGPSGGVADPGTGRLANGTGGKVSANVLFDPWTGMSTTSVVTATNQGQGATVTNPDAGASLHIDTASGTTDVTIAEYSSPPPGTPSFGAGATYVDIQLSNPSVVSQITITFINMSPGTVIYFYHPGTGWIACSNQTQIGTTITVTVTNSTTPTLSELIGTIFAEGTAKGNVNGDSVIDVLDARLCLQIATGFLTGTPVQRAAADVDNDGDVDLTDAQILAQYIIGIITALPGGG